MKTAKESILGGDKKGSLCGPSARESSFGKGIKGGIDGQNSGDLAGLLLSFPDSLAE
jgi:hypothetical protein